ncbi:lipid-A-disaccharide synthase [Lentisphaerota bacterium ZTH]|nr:lipid-A-disaccharide synthase [Lentisphaerota bacterium]WET05894.1 lipid-A-disaccharide synthase [Lentisphaerota bacterium ZTH]
MNQKDKKIWIFAGEASGDLYGAQLAEEMRQLGKQNNVKVKVEGMGGPAMKEAGVNILVDSTELGVVGLIEVLKHIFTFIKIFRFLVNKAITEKPDAIILIDYPGFNLRFAARMHKHNIPVIWYISPHVWTWGKKRIPKLAKFCRKMLVIFPFETEVYKPSGLDTEFVGHPLVDIVRNRRDKSITRDPDTLLLLPGSRAMEVNRLLLPMLQTAETLYKRHPNLKFVISTPRPKVFKMCQRVLSDFRTTNPDAPEFKLTCGDTPYWQQRAGTGLAASGTVTVESAIAGLPLVVAYKLNWLTLLVASMVVKLYRGFFTMVNIIANKEVFEEFLQWHVNSKELSQAVEKILPGGPKRARVESDINKVARQLSGGSEGALYKAAKACFEFTTKNL